MKFVVSYHAAKAGCIASMVSEASAPELLLNEFSALQCSTMFHSKPPAVFADKVHALRKDMQAAAALPQDQRAGKLAEFRSTVELLFFGTINVPGLALNTSYRPLIDLYKPLIHLFTKLARAKKK
jgi:hypothetical protein